MAATNALHVCTKSANPFSGHKGKWVGASRWLDYWEMLLNGDANTQNLQFTPFAEVRDSNIDKINITSPATVSQ